MSKRADDRLNFAARVVRYWRENKGTRRAAFRHLAAQEKGGAPFSTEGPDPLKAFDRYCENHRPNIDAEIALLDLRDSRDLADEIAKAAKARRPRGITVVDPKTLRGTRVYI